MSNQACAVVLGRYQSGQLGQTVNLLSDDFVGSNPALPTITVQRSFFRGYGENGVMVNHISGSSSVGRALAFQAKGRGFEFRLPLSMPM